MITRRPPVFFVSSLRHMRYATGIYCEDYTDLGSQKSRDQASRSSSHNCKFERTRQRGQRILVVSYLPHLHTPNKNHDRVRSPWSRQESCASIHLWSTHGTQPLLASLWGKPHIHEEHHSKCSIHSMLDEWCIEDYGQSVSCMVRRNLVWLMNRISHTAH